MGVFDRVEGGLKRVGERQRESERQRERGWGKKSVIVCEILQCKAVQWSGGEVKGGKSGEKL